MKMLKCATHGAVPWNGEVMCNACGRKFTTQDPSASTHAPLVCPCGVRLMPGTSRDQDFSARAICSGCFDAHGTKAMHSGPARGPV